MSAQLSKEALIAKGELLGIPATGLISYFQAKYGTDEFALQATQEVLEAVEASRISGNCSRYKECFQKHLAN